MLIKIIKCNTPTYWYAKKVGAHYLFYSEEETVYKVYATINDKEVIVPVLKDDSVEVEEKVEFDRRTSPERTVHRGRYEILKERSAFKTHREVEEYEQINKLAELKVYNLNDI